jgi:hypothetical protein
MSGSQARAATGLVKALWNFVPLHSGVAAPRVLPLDVAAEVATLCWPLGLGRVKEGLVITSSGEMALGVDATTEGAVLQRGPNYCNPKAQVFHCLILRLHLEGRSNFTTACWRLHHVRADSN